MLLFWQHFFLDYKIVYGRYIFTDSRWIKKQLWTGYHMVQIKFKYFNRITDMLKITAKYEQPMMTHIWHFLNFQMLFITMATLACYCCYDFGSIQTRLTPSLIYVSAIVSLNMWSKTKNDNIHCQMWTVLIDYQV